MSEDAEQLKARFSEVRLHTSEDARLEHLVRNCQWTEAAKVARDLGRPLTSGVVHVDFTKGRTTEGR